MGVSGLWPLIAELGVAEPPEQWYGKVIALDVSILIAQAQSVIPIDAVQNPVVRLAFYRVSALLRAGVRVLAVCDGPAPRLKNAAFIRRGYCGSQRGAFRARCERDIRPLLELMGVPCIFAAGEAEATCAWLEQLGLADGTCSRDGDALLFGSRAVVKRLLGSGNTSAQKSTFEVFRASTIEARLGLRRRHLIALSVMTRNDYFDGVDGIGPKTVIKLLSGRPEAEVFGVLKGLTEPSPPPPPPRPRKPTHCSVCRRPGTQAQHAKRGEPCEPSFENDLDGSCGCAWHVAFRREEPLRRHYRFTEGLRVRVRSLLQRGLATEFPPNDVVQAFLRPTTKNYASDDLRQRHVAVGQLASFLSARLGWGEEKAKEQVHKVALGVAVASLSLSRSDGDSPTSGCAAAAAATAQEDDGERSHSAGLDAPIGCERAAHELLTPCVVKERVKQRMPVYDVEWVSCFPSDECNGGGGGGEDGSKKQQQVVARTQHLRRLFARAYPRAVEQWEESKATLASKKRTKAKFGTSMVGQRTLRDIFSSSFSASAASSSSAAAAPLPSTPAKATTPEASRVRLSAKRGGQRTLRDLFSVASSASTVSSPATAAAAAATAAASASASSVHATAPLPQPTREVESSGDGGARKKPWEDGYKWSSDEDGSGEEETCIDLTESPAAAAAMVTEGQAAAAAAAACAASSSSAAAAPLPCTPVKATTPEASRVRLSAKRGGQRTLRDLFAVASSASTVSSPETAAAAAATAAASASSVHATAPLPQPTREGESSGNGGARKKPREDGHKRSSDEDDNREEETCIDLTESPAAAAAMVTEGQAAAAAAAPCGQSGGDVVDLAWSPPPALLSPPLQSPERPPRPSPRAPGAPKKRRRRNDFDSDGGSPRQLSF